MSLPHPHGWLILDKPRGLGSTQAVAAVKRALRKGRTPKECHDAAYRFLHVMAGNLPHFVDLVREMYAGNRVGYDHFSHDWPPAIRDHGRRLAFPE